MQIPETLITEALEKVGFDKNNYMKLVKNFKPEVFAQYLHMAFAVGFDKGIKFERKKHANNMQKPVMQLDKYGNQIKTFESCTDAGKAVERAKNTIARAAKLGSKCAGYYWRFI